MATMDGAALQRWVTEHVDHIFAFMDYEPTIEEADEVKSTLGYWLDNHEWASDDEFLHLGIDGTGSQFLVWKRASDQQAPVVFFGSEGGLGVLTATPAAFAQALAHRPWVDGYEEPASLTDNEGDDLDEDEAAEADKALATYKAAVEDRFGPLPSLAELTAGVDALNQELRAWVAERSPHFS